jgi:hypothetical protein
MTKKFVEKTTEEFAYDNEGFVIKKVTIKESYEEEIEKTATFRTDVDMNKYIKTTGVPTTATFEDPKSGSFTVTSTGDTSIQNTKADTNGIRHTVVVNGAINGTIDANSLAESVKKALKEASEYKKNHLI